MTVVPGSPRWIPADEVLAAVTPDEARRALHDALADGLEPADDPARLGVPAGTGQLLLMPSASARSVGVKVASVAPDNPSLGLERIQAWYVLLDAATLTPSVLLDGTALTTLRTPAVSAVAMDLLAPEPTSGVSAVVFGTGPQGVAHVEALRAIREVRAVTVVGRRTEALDEVAAELGDIATARAGTDSVEAAVRGAGVVVCATTAPEPLFDGSWVRDGACVVAIGSHEPTWRELDTGLMVRSKVIVEDLATARREAGDVVMAEAEHGRPLSGMHGLAELVRGEVGRASDRPNVFKSVGMAWQDLVVAELVAARTAGRGKE